MSTQLDNKPQHLIRVAQVMGHMSGGGVESTVMNYYRHINRNRIQFDFICDDDSKFIPEDEIRNLGGRVITVPPYKHIFSYIPSLTRVFRTMKPDIVHSNINALSVFSLYAAYKAKVPIRIAHSHSTSNPYELDKTLIKILLKPTSRVYSTDFAACSEHAAKWLFGNKCTSRGEVKIIRNAIDVKKFMFNENIRLQKREQLKIDNNTFVIGQVGRLCYQKNQLFTLEVFKKIHELRSNSLLIFVGHGDLLGKLRSTVQKLGLEDSVLFLGNRDDVAELYQSFDTLIFPSKYEGLGMAAIEGQTSGLHIFASVNVPSEAQIIERGITFLPLRNPDRWASQIVGSSSVIERSNNSAAVSDAGYDINVSARELEDWYELLSEGGHSVRE